MGLSLRSIRNPFGLVRLFSPSSITSRGHKFTITRQSTTMANPPAVNSQTTWQGAGAAEFDLRSIFDLYPNSMQVRD